MSEPVNEKPQMEEPSTEYGLREAVMDTNAAVQRLADLMSQAFSQMGISADAKEEEEG